MGEGKPLGMIRAFPGPQLAEGVAPVHVQRAPQLLPAEPVGRFPLGTLRRCPQLLVVLLLEDESVEAYLDAMVVGHAHSESHSGQ